MQHRHHHGNPAMRGLNLSDAQKTQIAGIMKGSRDAQRRQIEGVLTPDQRTQMRANLARERSHSGKPNGPRPQAPTQ
jgi:Spy/CpxP family protein refolding chaperone